MSARRAEHRRAARAVDARAAGASAGPPTNAGGSATGLPHEHSQMIDGVLIGRGVTEIEAREILSFEAGLLRCDLEGVGLDAPFLTAPGCDKREHREEVGEIMLSLARGQEYHRQIQRMHCGCLMLLRDAGSLQWQWADD